MLSRLTAHVVDFLKCEDGPTAVEYCVLLAGVVTVCLIAIGVIGTRTDSNFNALASQLSSS